MNTSNLFDLKGKIALVTGASRGIGESIAKLLAAHGAHVIVASRKLDACQKVADDILSHQGSAEAYACHIGESSQIEALYAHIEDTHGGLDILINNAATNPYFGHILDTPPEAFDKTVDVNIRGYFFMSSLGAQQMKKRGGGCIINISSVNGVIPGHFQGIYSITKAAVISMTKAFAKECAELNIRVNAILPGATDTKFASTLISNPEILKQLMTHVPMGRIAEPDEIAGTALYLASNAASYTTGSCINVDGGYLLV